MYAALRVASHIDYRLVCVSVYPSVTLVYRAHIVGYLESNYISDLRFSEPNIGDLGPRQAFPNFG